MPKARRAIIGACFDPETLRMLADVLEEVWTAVAPQFENDARTVERERMRLASIIIDLAKDYQLSAFQIARTATRLMRQTPVAGNQSRPARRR